MPKRLLIGALIVISLISLYFASNGKVYNIGVLADFKGENHSLAESGFNALSLALNELGIDHYRLIPIQAPLDKPHELVDQLQEAEIDLIIGPFLSNTLVKLYEPLESSGFTTFIPSATSDIITGKQNHIYRLLASTSMQGIQFADEISKTKYKKVKIIYSLSNQAYSKVLGESIAQRLNELGLSHELLPADDQLTNERLTTENGDACYFLAMGGVQSGLLVQRLRLLGVDSDIYLSAWAASEELITYVSEKTQNLHIHFNASPTYHNELSNFTKAFQSTYTKNPSISSIYCYEIIYLIQYLEDHGVLDDPGQLQQYLTHQPEYDGKIFKMKFRPDGTGDIKMNYLTIKDGEFIYESK